jgi:aspartyl-tRNA(Asn)/glutamyl-tRNA(Gln) amidotransferase subunit A
MHTLKQLAEQLATNTLSARDLVEKALRNIADPNGEGARVFVSVASERARTQADEVDRLRASGPTVPPFAGIPLAIKDLFDIAGEVTRAGSRVLAEQPPATVDAPAVARLRAAGFIFIGRSNMTEFAYSGLGLNPHYGTPLNPFDRATGRIPGGSSSGSAVAVTDDMAAASLGTDTGGSCRIPAAFTGIVGFKPTAHRVPREGAIPLSPALDSVGPLANSVQCCASLDAILRNATPRLLEDVPLADVRLLLPTTLVLADMDDVVAHTFEATVARLSRAGAKVVSRPLDSLARIPQINARGGFSAPEAYAWHKELLERHFDAYDPRVARRIMKGRDVSAADLQQLRSERARMIETIDEETFGFDAIIMPTVPIIAPPLAAFDKDEDYARLNALVLRNPSLANFLDRCSISLPMHEPGAAPAGLMLIARHDEDERLLALAQTIERALQRHS